MQPLSAPRRQPPPLAAIPLRRDPAPSRWAYRMQRLWLTPLFRVMFRVGVPTFVLVSVVGIVLADEDRRMAIAGGITEIRTQFQNRPEFMVGLVSVVGASPELADVVRARLDIKLPQSSFDIDLAAARARIQELDAIARADLIVRSGGVLEVAITEREPALLWRTAEGVEMLDATGHRVASLAARSDRPDLPLIAGEAADSATPEALALLAAAAPIADRVRGLVRVGERRWDVVLDRNQRILLPEEKPIAAIERLIALHQAGDLLGRDILTVDLRTEHRPVLRLAPYALNQLRQSQGIDISGSQL